MLLIYAKFVPLCLIYQLLALRVPQRLRVRRALPMPLALLPIALTAILAVSLAREVHPHSALHVKQGSI